MKHNTILLLALATGAAHADASLFRHPVPEKADDTTYRYIGLHTTIIDGDASFNYRPDGSGETIGTLAGDSKVRVLLADREGNHLVATEYGITGWAQPTVLYEKHDPYQPKKQNPSGSENFPALKETRDVPITRYNPKLGKPFDQYYNYHYADADSKTAIPGSAPLTGDGTTNPNEYSRAFASALIHGGKHYNFDMTADPALPPGIHLSPASDKQPPQRGSLIDLPWLFHLTIPGNGCLYSEDHTPPHYFVARQKWVLGGRKIREIAQPWYYLDLATTYHGRGSAEQPKAEPLPLYRDIGNSEVVATITPEEKITVILARQPACTTTAPNACKTAWLLIQNREGQTGWHSINFEDTSVQPPLIDEIQRFDRE
ncbi:hypothetical protein [uncultured Cardiobacterium sp.]|uniref:hypothetical protein n=1 Tax=uncultured Cardiobacterium sp. TaxID=417619 RepID=UPI00261A4CC2|nr:hypothetical protein [uncultured Cardiobacterium sp.]